MGCQKKLKKEKKMLGDKTLPTFNANHFFRQRQNSSKKQVESNNPGQAAVHRFYSFEKVGNSSY